MVTEMSLTSILKSQPKVVDFLQSRINNLPEKPGSYEKKRFLLGENPALVGTAFDYAFRFEVLRKYPYAKEYPWIAENGARLIHDKKWRDVADRTIEIT